MRNRTSDAWKAAPIYLAMLAPLLGIAALAAVLAAESALKYRATETLDAVLHLSTDASNLAHELQKERGMSAGYTSSGGRQFGERLQSQRAMTDDLIAQVGPLVRASSEAHPSEEARKRDHDRAGRIGQALDDIGAWRAQIDRREVTVSELAQFYTALITDLLSYPDDPLIDGTADEMARQNAMYQNILMAKEFAGLERAAGASGFAAGEFSVERYSWFNGLLQRQAYVLERLRRLGAAHEVELLDAVLTGAAALRVQELRQIAADSLQTHDVQGITGSEWFEASTAYLGELRKLEQQLASEMVAHADDLAAKAWFWAVGIAAAAFLFIVISGLIGWRFVHGLIVSLYGLRDAIRRIDRAEQNIEIPGLERGDMVGEIARSLSSIREKGADAARVEAAIENANTPLIIVDNNDAVRFANSAYLEMEEHNRQALDCLVERDDTGTRNGAGLVRAIDDAVLRGSGLAKAQGQKAIELQTGGRIMEAQKNSVLDGNGDQIGQSIQLLDVTTVRNLEKQVVDVLAGIAEGRLGTRVEQIDDMGFTSVAARGINGLMDAFSDFMAELDTALAAMARGDLTAKIVRDFKGDFRTASDTFNGNLEALVGMVQQVVISSDGVKGQAYPIAESSRDLARRAEEQAAALEEVSATMEEISTTISNSADSATEASKLAETATSRAENGRAVLEETQTAMSKIEKNSAHIVDIVGTIDAIAFQTNLLALNAAVEAARAGDAGKGFAVVASEVRTLAGRAADAANEIRELIEVSAADVGTGVDLMEKTKVALDQIAEVVVGLSGTVSSITNASREQALGVREINATIAQLDEMTQRNAAAADQGASGAETLVHEAARLMETVSQFKTSDDATGSSAAA